MNLGDLFRSFNTERRQQLAKEGKALPDGSFLIETVGDLKNALEAFSRRGSKAPVKRHIMKRARALGQTQLLPEDWNASEDEPEVLSAEPGDVVMTDKATPAAPVVEPVKAEEPKVEVTTETVAPETLSVDAMTEKMAALERENKELKDTMAAEKLAARKAELVRKAESFKALPVDKDEFAEKLIALQDQDEALADWIVKRFEGFDAAMAESGLLKELGTDQEDASDPHQKFLTIVDRIHAERYDKVREKYSSALAVASQEYPELAALYAAGRPKEEKNG